MKGQRRCGGVEGLSLRISEGKEWERERGNQEGQQRGKMEEEKSKREIEKAGKGKERKIRGSEGKEE